MHLRWVPGVVMMLWRIGTAGWGRGGPRLERLRLFAAVSLACALAGCAALSDNAALDAGDLAVNPTLLVATDRKPVDGARAQPWFGSERASALNYARARLSPPDGGRFSRAALGLSDWRIEAVEPAQSVDELLPRAAMTRDVLLYVHGFNQTFETAALDAARLSQGIHFHGETMVFSWPSKAKLFDYGYDRESALWSRDALEHVLSGLIASPMTARIHLVAHSIGSMPAMEALRQAYARQGRATAERMGAVVFAAPDIDMDVFASSIERLGPLARKITVISATNDRALAVSSFLAGGVSRVGAAEQEKLRRLGVHVIDASREGWGLINHDLFLSNVRTRQVIRDAIEGRAPSGIRASR
ncbi:MAG TPA: alpha/beta hydrolase [Xanthobacteraceae bacterium]